MTFVRTTRKVELFANILHHLIAHGLGQFVLKFLEKKSKGFQVTVQVKSKAVTGVFRSISRFISKTIKDTAIVAMKKCCVSYFRLGHLLLIRSQQQHCFIDTIHRSVNSVTPWLPSCCISVRSLFTLLSTDTAVLPLVDTGSRDCVHVRQDEIAIPIR